MTGKTARHHEAIQDRWSDLPQRVVAVALAWPLLLAAVWFAPAWLTTLIWIPVLMLATHESADLVVTAWPNRSRPFLVTMALAIGLVPLSFPVLRTVHGPEAALLAILVAWGGDCGAYLAGRFLGRHPIAPRLSPRKTWEGAFGGVITAVALVAMVQTLGLVPHAPPYLLLLVLPVNLLAQCGDLAESALKRRAGARHSGYLIPGGGGVLDAMDGLSAASLAWLLLF